MTVTVMHQARYSAANFQGHCSLALTSRQLEIEKGGNDAPRDEKKTQTSKRESQNSTYLFVMIVNIHDSLTLDWREWW